ncbi:MAG: hypothetical protein JNK48_29845 [Bryobacterales bacterium]|nr:hypothetical protein [Bryobacterales bacterium]
MILSTGTSAIPQAAPDLAPRSAATNGRPVDPGSERFRDVIDASRAMPVEVFADTVFRVLSANAEGSRKWRQQLVDDVYAKAGEAARRTHLTYLRDERLRDLAFLVAASNQRLDELSIRVKAIQYMSRIDAKKAAEWLEVLALPKLETAVCGDFASEDTDAIFNLLAEAGPTLYNSKEGHDRYEALLRRHISSISSIMQLAPAANMLLAAKLDGDSFGSLLTAYTARVADVRGDDTTFAIAIAQGQLLPSIDELLKRSAALDRGTEPLLAATRQFLAAHLAQPRCGAAPRIESDSEKAKDARTAAIEFYNGRLERYLSAGAPLTPKADAPMAKVVSNAGDVLNLDKESCLMEVSRHLLVKDSDKPFNWTGDLDRCLTRIRKWKPEGVECRECIFVVQTKAFLTLATVATEASDLQQVVGAYLQLMEGNPIQKEKPAEWLTCLKAMLNSGRSVSKADEQRLTRVRSPFLRPHLFPDKVLSGLSDSRDPIVHLYLQLERLAPQNYSFWWTTLSF